LRHDTTGGDRGTHRALDPLAQRILELIGERGLRPGDAIPTELELMDELSVSRNSVREAVRGLRALGIVDIRHGHGTFVGEASLRALSPSLSFRAMIDADDSVSGLRNLIDIRELIEVGMIRRVAGGLTEASLARLTELCDRMTGPDVEPAVDREFHRTLYAEAGNPLVGQVVDVFWDAYVAAHAALAAPPPLGVRATARKHRAIVDALRAADPDAAAAAMTAHFADIHQRLAATH
jgi:DNA-binding FadR family transcriptional regulator